MTRKLFRQLFHFSLSLYFRIFSALSNSDSFLSVLRVRMFCELPGNQSPVHVNHVSIIPQYRSTMIIFFCTIKKCNKFNKKRKFFDSNLRSKYKDPGVISEVFAYIMALLRKASLIICTEVRNSCKRGSLHLLCPFQMHSMLPDDRYLFPERCAWIPGYEA